MEGNKEIECGTAHSSFSFMTPALPLAYFFEHSFRFESIGLFDRKAGVPVLSNVDAAVNFLTSMKCAKSYGVFDGLCCCLATGHCHSNQQFSTLANNMHLCLGPDNLAPTCWD